MRCCTHDSRLESLVIALAVRLADHLAVGHDPPPLQKLKAATEMKQFVGRLRG